MQEVWDLKTQTTNISLPNTSKPPSLDRVAVWGLLCLGQPPCHVHQATPPPCLTELPIYPSFAGWDGRQGAEAVHTLPLRCSRCNLCCSQ